MPRLVKALLLALVTATLTASLEPALADDPPGKAKKAKGKGKGKQKADDGPRSEGDKLPPDSPTAWSTFPANMDPRVREILIDLRGQFNLMDTDTSWSLEAAELARGFRGKAASVPEWGFGVSATSEALEKRPKIDEIKKRYPDQYFLSTYDLDRDGKVTKPEFQSGFMDPVVGHFTEVFKKKDQMDKIQLQLNLKTIDRVQRAKLEADMKILNANLRAGLNGFNHMMALERMSARNAQWRTNVAWYHQFNR